MGCLIFMFAFPLVLIWGMIKLMVLLAILAWNPLLFLLYWAVRLTFWVLALPFRVLATRRRTVITTVVTTR